jgi:hypothetical protein
VGVIVGPVVAGVVVLGALGVLAWAYTAGPLAHHRRTGVADEGSVEGDLHGEEHEGAGAAAAAVAAARSHDSLDEEAARDGDDARSAGTDGHDHDGHDDAHSDAHTSEHDHDSEFDAAGADINVEVRSRGRRASTDGEEEPEEESHAPTRRSKGAGRSLSRS